MRKIAWLISLAAVLLLTSTAQAQILESSAATDPGWSGSYWNNINFSGPPVLQRNDAAINFDWGGHSPGTGVADNHFAARWTRDIDTGAASGRFTTRADDGIRVFVDGQLVLDAWNSIAGSTHNGNVHLSAGTHHVVVEYWQGTGLSFAQLSVTTTPDPAITQWRGEYYNNTSLSGSPALVRNDADINFSWGDASPASGVNADNFSVRWTRDLNLPAGSYWFTLSVDDGARLWVNNHLLIDSWQDQWVHVYTGNIGLPGGPVPVKLEYYEHSGGAVAILTWSTSAPEPTITDWRGEYYNNTSLSGSPALVRNDGDIHFDWGTGSPAPGVVNADNFSVRWTRNLNLAAGTYRFMMTMDDGCRLWVNGTLLLDDWSDQPANTHGGDIWVPGGPVPVKFEYYERGDKAIAKLDWWVAPAPEPVITDWRGEYYNNKELSGNPVLVRNDPVINFNWDTGSPAPGIVNADDFSVRWTRNVNLPAGTYHFTLSMDDGVRLWVNGQLVVDDWSDQAPNTHGVDVYVPGGSIPIKYEYYEHGERAVAALSWASPAVPPPATEPETVLVDDGDAGFARGGSSATWYRAYYGWGGDLYWTRNNDMLRAGYNWGAWYPSLQPATYEVFAHIPAQSGATNNARYWVSHAGGKSLHIANQNGSIARWESLGTFRFTGTRSDYVSLTDITYERYLSGIVTWDAMKWERR